jgi:hypothetical protein
MWNGSEEVKNMIGSLIAVVALIPSGQGPTAKQLVEKMLGRYFGANTLVGQIKLTVATNAGSASLSTNLQFEKPAKLYLYQQKLVSNPDPDQPSRWLVTSDGSMFSYNVPNDKYYSAPGLRLVEPVVNQRAHVTSDYRAIYAAASKSLGDRSMPLDIAISRLDDLKYRRNQWATMSVTGQKDVGGIRAYLVSGDYRDYLGAKVTGKYQMAITEEGDLLQYAEDTHIAVGEGANTQTVEVINTWDVSLKVNAAVDPALFKVVVK